MSRNTSGNYALPTGNPVLGGTTISSTWANETLGDLASEMTDSLNRSGKGGMLAPLKIEDGTAANPGLTWAADPDCGIYRAGVNSIGMSASSTQIQRWETTGSAISVPVTVTTAASNTAGLTTTGNGTGAGLVATGGATGAGLTAQGGGSSAGVSATGGATGAGGVFSGGATGGNGITATATGTANSGGIFIGAASGLGVEARAGTAATASTSQIAMRSKNGYVQFDTVNPNSDVAFTNMLTPMNVPKAWATIQTTGGGSTAATILAGFNVASAAVTTNTVTLTLAQGILNTNFAVSVTPANPGLSGSGTYGGTDSVAIACKNLDGLVVPTPNTSGTAISVPLFDFQAGTSRTLYVVVFGAQ